MVDDARSFLLSRSLPEPEVDEAAEQGWLPLLVADQLLFGGRPRYTAETLAEAAGIELDVARQLWRAMGFTDIPEDQVAFYPEDVEAIVLAKRAITPGPESTATDPFRPSLETVLRYTRTVSSAVSRIAEANADEIVAAVRGMHEAGLSDDDVARWLHEALDVNRVELLLGYFFRRQLRAALWRKLAVPADRLGELDVTVGFVDLVRFTALTEEVDEEELDTLVTRFEEVAHERIAAGEGRMVKMIGDEVMFVADDALHGTLIALDLVEAYAAEDHLPPARAGLACGGVLTRDGDYFGPVVNLASRIVDVARPNSVVTSDVVHERLSDHDALVWRRLPPKRLKGIGRTTLWSVRPGDGRPWPSLGILARGIGAAHSR